MEKEAGVDRERRYLTYDGMVAKRQANTNDFVHLEP